MQYQPINPSRVSEVIFDVSYDGALLKSTSKGGVRPNRKVVIWAFHWLHYHLQIHGDDGYESHQLQRHGHRWPRHASDQAALTQWKTQREVTGTPRTL